MEYIPILGAFNNEYTQYTFLFGNGDYCTYSEETKGVVLGHPRKMPEPLSVPGEASKITGCMTKVYDLFIFKNDGTVVTNSIVFDRASITRPISSVFPVLAPYSNRIIAILQNPIEKKFGFPSYPLKYQIFLQGQTVLEFDLRQNTITERELYDVYPGMSYRFYPVFAHMRAIVRDVKYPQKFHIFLDNGNYLTYNENHQLGSMLSIDAYWPGIYYLPSQSPYSIGEVYTLTCEQTSEFGNDEVIMEYYVDGQKIFTEGPRDMNELNSSTAASNPEKLRLSRWQLNKRFYFKNNMSVKIIEHDNTTKNDNLGTLELTKTLYEKGQKFFSDAGKYKLSYKVTGRESPGFDFSTLFFSFRYYHDSYVRVIDGHGETNTVIEGMQHQFASAALAAQQHAEDYNESAKASMEGALATIGQSVGFEVIFTGVPAVIGASATATIVAVQAGGVGVGAAAGMAALQAAAVTGGVGAAIMAVAVAIALPIYFASLKFSVAILIANNLDLNLEVERILVENGNQINGTFEGDLILRKTPANIAMAVFSFNSFQNIRGGVKGEIHLKPRYEADSRRIMDKVVLYFEVPMHGRNTASLSFSGSAVNSSLRYWSKVRIDELGNAPNLLVKLSET